MGRWVGWGMYDEGFWYDQRGHYAQPDDALTDHAIAFRALVELVELSGEVALGRDRHGDYYACCVPPSDVQVSERGDGPCLAVFRALRAAKGE